MSDEDKQPKLSGVASSRAVSPVDARIRVLAAMLEPPITLARIMGLSLDDLLQLVSIGYFRELRGRGHSWGMMTRRLGKSRRTIATLARTAADEGPPLGASQRLGWRRQIVRTLAKRGPLDAETIARDMPDASPSDIEEEMAHLAAQGIVDEAEDGRVEVAAGMMELTSDDFDVRIDSLRHFLESVAHVVYRRFFSRDGDALAFARVLSFTASREQLAAIRDAQFDSLARAAMKADSEANASPDAVQASAVLALVETLPRGT